MQAGGVAANHIAKWNGTSWSSIGTGASNGVIPDVLAMTQTTNGDIYVACDRITQFYAPLYKWNGTAWTAIGTGLNEVINGLEAELNGKLYAGGGFTATGDGSKVMAHIGIYDPKAPLATTAATPATLVAQLFPNPAHGTATLRLPAGAPRLPLTDALGRVVRRYPAPVGSDAKLDLRGLPAGVYSVRCGQFTQRLVVE